MIRQISRNKRIVEWLYQSGRVRQRMATVDLQLQGYSGRKRIASHTLPGYRFIVRGRRRGRNLGEEIVIRSFDLVERVLLLMAQMVHERDVVVNRVAEVGLRRASEPAVAPPAAAVARRRAGADCGVDAEADGNGRVVSGRCGAMARARSEPARRVR